MMPTPAHEVRSSSVADTVITGVLVATAIVLSCVVVGSRGAEVGTDTEQYASFYRSLEAGPVQSRLEPGFVWLSKAAQMAGLGVHGYQAALHLCLLLAVLLATRGLYNHLGIRRYFIHLAAGALALAFASPVFLDASINLIRQGIAAPLVLSALLGFQRRRLGVFLAYGGVAVGFHYSSVLYLVCAPILLLRERTQAILTVLASGLYCAGVSESAVKVLAPQLYAAVLEYQQWATYRAGVRLDFAVFTLACYGLMHVFKVAAMPAARDRVAGLSGVYLTLALPFFALGWGNFSNRFLLPAWISVSLIGAAAAFCSRFALLRSPFVLRFELMVSFFAFFVQVAGVSLM